MTRARMLVFLLLVSAVPAPAWADLTAFIGDATTPSSRLTKGVAAGAGLLIVGFEFEYGATSSDVGSNAPSLKTGMGNVLLQTPGAIFHVQPYFTAGAGVFREVLGPHSDTSFGVNVGGGAKIPLAGPLQLRVDYRVFRLGSSALYSPSSRLYAGLNLKF